LLPPGLLRLSLILFIEEVSKEGIIILLVLKLLVQLFLTLLVDSGFITLKPLLKLVFGAMSMTHFCLLPNLLRFLKQIIISLVKNMQSFFV